MATTKTLSPQASRLIRDSFTVCRGTKSRSIHSRTCFFSSSAPDATADDASAAAALDDNLRSSTATKHAPNKALFPWRHETWENPLPRMVPGTPESVYNVHIRPAGKNLLANVFLGVPVWKTLLTDWQGDLAQYCSFAFAQGVAGIMSNVYQVPLDKINLEDTVAFQFPVKEQEETNNDSETNPDDFCPRVDGMLDRPLRNLYQSAHESGRDQLEIRLQMEPKRAMLYEVFCLPFFSRAAAEADLTVSDRIRDIIKAMPLDFRAGFQLLYDYLYEQLKKKDRFETTLELQVLVDCQEVFQVFDKESGVLLQGSEDGELRTILHLVRFETTVVVEFDDNFPYLPRASFDNWVISDIDDLLGPKKWYHT